MIYQYINVSLLWLMRLALAASAVILGLRYEPLALLALLALAISFVPLFLRHKYHIEVPWWIELLIVLAFVLDIIVGEQFQIYYLFTGFDWFTHLLGTFIVSIIALSIVYTLKVHEKIKVTPGMIWLFTVMFAMALGGFYEILEFTTDSIFGANAQQGLTNTMLDLIFDLASGIITATWGTYYLTKLEGRKVRDVLKPSTDFVKLFGVKIREKTRKIRRGKRNLVRRRA